MFPRSTLLAAALALVVVFSPVAAEGPLVEQRGSLRFTANAKALQSELRLAMGEAMGCGGQVSEERLAEIREALSDVWLTLPQKSPGRVDRRSLRYLVHRYFYRKSALLIRGFEPSRPSNVSSWGSDDILRQTVPSYVEAVLESKHAQERGFNLQDVAFVAATVEQLIFNSETMILERVYKQQIKPVEQSLSADEMGLVLEEYMIRWLLGEEDYPGFSRFLHNRALAQRTIPHWDEIASLAQGQIKAVEFQRQRVPAATARPGHNALSSRYSFEDAHDVVGGITRSFASFWDSVCTSMKSSLVQMDVHRTGRVPLSKFYSSALDSEWRFGESEAYLRELGALDETSQWYGKQVIIPNYLQAASNCIVSTPHYLVCCVNECESLLGEIEGKVRSPVANPGEILALISNMTSQATVDHDDPPHLGGSERAQLEQIAALHGGTVPLHGRLFAQWLHYVFPRECPFPHKTGTAATVAPGQYGGQSMATRLEMQEHAAMVNDTNATVGIDRAELHWMSQWSSEEELAVDYGKVLHASWSRSVIAGGLALLLLSGVATTVGVSWSTVTPGTGLLPTHAKSHLV